MKKTILGALLLGALASQSALAEIRTFDFTASVSDLTVPTNPWKYSAPWTEVGTSVTLATNITGQVSFDDEGIDWSANGGEVPRPALTFTLALHDGATVVDLAPAFLNHGPASADWPAWLSVSGSRDAGNIAAALTVRSPDSPFAWNLDDGASGTLQLSWMAPNKVTYWLVADVNSFSAVSPVPEPSTWAMLLVGAAAVGGAKRRRAGRTG